MSIVDWAEKELEQLVTKDDEFQKGINKDILAVVKLFASQGHTGFTAGYARNILNRLLDWKPITPLTGEEDEWNDVMDGDETNLQQNKRCSAVFRKNFDNTTASYIHGKIFTEDDGQSWHTSSDSSVPVEFPFLVPEKPEKVYL